MHALRLAGATGVVVALIGTGPAMAAPHGTRLTATVSRVDGSESNGQVSAQLPTFLAFSDGVRFDVRRRDYQTHLQITRTTDIGGATRTTPLDPRLLDGWNGFRKGMRIVVRDAAGHVVWSKYRTWCPNNGFTQRLTPNSVDTPTYPELCPTNPFTRAAVWGVDRGWAVSAGDYVFFNGSAQRYRVTVSIAPRVAAAINLPADRRSITITVNAKHQSDGPPVGGTPGAVRTLAPAQSSTTARAMPRSLQALPPRDTLPDIVSLPAYWISVTNENGHDQLNFAANEWNAGPGPMVVEGYRTPGRRLMKAFQVFYRNGVPVASRPSGTMEFHTAPQHNHWHFLDFARYDLVTRTGTFVTTSGKQSWCLAPTDAIDLTVPNALWRPLQTGLTSTCGGIDAMWLRETLPVGWGDTYLQNQTVALDITRVPNGVFKIRITANPKGSLREASRANNVSYRTVVLGGTKGKRTVRVAKFGLVDSEKGFGQFR